MLERSWMYGAGMPVSLCSTSNPNFSTNAITSSSVSSTLPGSAIPEYTASAKMPKFEYQGEYLGLPFQQ